MERRSHVDRLRYPQAGEKTKVASCRAINFLLTSRVSCILPVEGLPLNYIIAAIDAEISRLQEARELLSAGGSVSSGIGKKRNAAKRTLSDAARAKISAAQKKRWAAVKRRW